VAIGAGRDRQRAIMRAPRWGPQSFTRGLLLGDVLAWTRGERAAELVAFPSSVSRTYFGAYRPGSAQRIPPLLNTGYGHNYAAGERVRTALVARARLFRSSLALDQGQADAIDAGRAAAGIDAARSQARIAGRY
jgi:hypothetical protein